MELIKCDALVTGYADKPVVKNLTFSINIGDYLCILGENGSGKTTLLRTLLGFNKPLGGSISFHNLRKNEIGYLPQQTQTQRDFPASAYEVVLSGVIAKSRFTPFYTAAQKNEAKECMELLHVRDLAGRCYRELSGGQQQRVLLARALCASSKLLLLDEPTAGLDPDATEDMYSAISELNKSGVTIIMVSHDVDAAVKYASHVLHISRKPKFFGKTKDYLQSDAYRSMIRGGV
ncbi:MAG: metal ABC transporter ATP-binding protein [Clostridia bacterium]|nr:metal ABC transporter ATP-binding protein [Clostridia bacterium]